MSPDVLLSPTDAVFAADRHAAYHRLRDETPVVMTSVNGQPSWLLSRYEDVERAFKDPRARVQPTVGEIPEYVGTGAAADFFRYSLPCMDAPSHTVLRKLVTPAFAPRAVAAMRGWVEELIDAGFDRLAEQAGEFDFVREFGARVPAEIACRLVHAPVGDAELLLDRQLALNPVLSQGNITVAELAAAEDAARFYYDYVGEMIDTLRGKVAADDPVGALLAADESVLSRVELLTTLIGFLVASYHTTMVAFTNAVHALLRHRDQWDLLAAEPDLAAGAWEECLRFEAPVHFVWRYAGALMEFTGQRVEAGSHLLLAIASAGRDERRFPDPDRFDIRRADKRHLAFVAGGHYCLGAPLSRLEGEAFLRRLPQRLPGLRPAGDEPVRHADLSFPMITRLDVAVS